MRSKEIIFMIPNMSERRREGSKLSACLIFHIVSRKYVFQWKRESSFFVLFRPNGMETYSPVPRAAASIIFCAEIFPIFIHEATHQIPARARACWDGSARRDDFYWNFLGKIIFSFKNVIYLNVEISNCPKICQDLIEGPVMARLTSIQHKKCMSGWRG